MNPKKPPARFNTALLIDDNEIDNLINEKMLQGTNFAENIYVYTSGRSALEYLKNLERNININSNLKPEVIFLDINMPIMDGFQFLDEFERINKAVTDNCRIIMLTTSINPKDRKKSEKHNLVLKFINKPLNEGGLAEIV